MDHPHHPHHHRRGISEGGGGNSGGSGGGGGTSRDRHTRGHSHGGGGRGGVGMSIFSGAPTPHGHHTHGAYGGGGGGGIMGPNGVILEGRERDEYCRRKGWCRGCGTKTHKVTWRGKDGLNNEWVMNGVCLRCHPDARKRMTATVEAVAAVGPVVSFESDSAVTEATAATAGTGATAATGATAGTGGTSTTLASTGRSRSHSLGTEGAAATSSATSESSGGSHGSYSLGLKAKVRSKWGKVMSANKTATLATATLATTGGHHKRASSSGGGGEQVGGMGGEHDDSDSDRDGALPLQPPPPPPRDDTDRAVSHGKIYAPPPAADCDILPPQSVDVVASSATSHASGRSHRGVGSAGPTTSTSSSPSCAHPIVHDRGDALRMLMVLNNNEDGSTNEDGTTENGAVAVHTLDRLRNLPDLHVQVGAAIDGDGDGDGGGEGGGGGNAALPLLEQIAKVMKRHSRDASLQRAGCGAIWRLVASSSSSESSSESTAAESASSIQAQNNDSGGGEGGDGGGKLPPAAVGGDTAASSTSSEAGSRKAAAAAAAALSSARQAAIQSGCLARILSALQTFGSHDVDLTIWGLGALACVAGGSNGGLAVGDAGEAGGGKAGGAKDGNKDGEGGDGDDGGGDRDEVFETNRAAVLTIYESGGLDVIEAALKNHIGSPEVMEWSARALNGLVCPRRRRVVSAASSAEELDGDYYSYSAAFAQGSGLDGRDAKAGDKSGCSAAAAKAVTPEDRLRDKINRMDSGDPPRDGGNDGSAPPFAAAAARAATPEDRLREKMNRMESGDSRYGGNDGSAPPFAAAAARAATPEDRLREKMNRMESGDSRDGGNDGPSPPFAAAAAKAVTPEDRLRDKMNRMDSGNSRDGGNDGSSPPFAAAAAKAVTPEDRLREKMNRMESGDSRTGGNDGSSPPLAAAAKVSNSGKGGSYCALASSVTPEGRLRDKLKRECGHASSHPTPKDPAGSSPSLPSHDGVGQSSGSAHLQYTTTIGLTEDEIAPLRRSAVLPALLTCMQQNIDATVAQEWAFSFLWLLIDHSNREGGSEVPAPAPAGGGWDLLKQINDGGSAGYGGAALCVQILWSRQKSERLQEMALALLHALLRHRPGSLGPEEIVGIAKALMKEYPANAGIQDVALSVLADAVPDHEAMVTEGGGIRSVIDAMESHYRGRGGRSSSIQMSACWILWGLSTKRSHWADPSILSSATRAVSLASVTSSTACNVLANFTLLPNVDANGISIDAIVRKLSTASSCGEENPGVEPEYICAGCRAVSNVCILDVSKVDDVVKAGGADALVRAMTVFRSNESAQDEAMGALCQVLSSSKDYHRKAVVDAGGIETIEEAMREFNSTESIQVKGLYALCMLAMCQSDDAPVIREGVVDAVVKAMEKFPDHTDIQTRSCLALRNLSIAANAKSAFSAAELINSLVELIHRSNSSVLQKEACGAIYALIAKCTERDTIPHFAAFNAMIKILDDNRGDDEHPFNAVTVNEALGGLQILTQVAIELESNLNANMETIDVIVSSVYAAMDAEVPNAEVVESAFAVFLNMSKDAECVNDLIQCGCVVAVIDGMQEMEGVPGIEELGCEILSQLCVDNLEVKFCIMESDGIESLVSAMMHNPDHATLQTNACRILAQLTIDEESRYLITQQGGVMLIVGAMQNLPDEQGLHEEACSALSNLVRDMQEEALIESNVVGTVLDALKRHANVPMVQEKALGILQNLSMRSATTKDVIASNGGIEVILSAIKEGMASPDVLERGFIILWSLAVLDRNQDRIADADGIKVIVNAMMASVDLAKVQKQACGCLCTLSASRRCKERVVNQGGLDAILFSMWSHFNSESLLTEACRALSSLAVSSSKDEVIIVKETVIDAVMTAMKQFPVSGKLLELACLALRNFCLNPTNMERMREKVIELEPLLRKASADFPGECSERANQVVMRLKG